MTRLTCALKEVAVSSRVFISGALGLAGGVCCCGGGGGAGGVVCAQASDEINRHPKTDSELMVTTACHFSGRIGQTCRGSCRTGEELVKCEAVPSSRRRGERRESAENTKPKTAAVNGVAASSSVRFRGRGEQSRFGKSVTAFSPEFCNSLRRQETGVRRLAEGVRRQESGVGMEMAFAGPERWADRTTRAAPSGKEAAWTLLTPDS
jgi:hypothetical protein